jgi:hypothetical protein
MNLPSYEKLPCSHVNDRGIKGVQGTLPLNPHCLILITSFMFWDISLVPVLHIQPSSNPDILFSENYRTYSVRGCSDYRETDLSSDVENTEMVSWNLFKNTKIQGYIGLQRFTNNSILLFSLQPSEIPYSDSYVS